MSEINSIAMKIKRFRKEKNMSQEELSAKSGINISNIKKYEIGYRNPKSDQLLKIANALDISINEFLDFEITTVSDVMSLLMKLDEQTDMKIEAQKDKDGNYIPETISISFNDQRINNVLADYLAFKDQKHAAESDSVDCDFILNIDNVVLAVERAKKDSLTSSGEK